VEPKGAADAQEMLFGSFNARRVREISVVIDDLVGHEHTEHSKVAGLDDLSDEAKDKTFIGFRSHDRSLTSSLGIIGDVNTQT
jgi:hypothetical protein